MSIKNATAKAADAASDALEQMVDATMDFADKAMQATKQKTVEAVDITKDIAHKAAEATKKTVAESPGWEAYADRRGTLPIAGVHRFRQSGLVQEACAVCALRGG